MANSVDLVSEQFELGIHCLLRPYFWNILGKWYLFLLNIKKVLSLVHCNYWLQFDMGLQCLYDCQNFEGELAIVSS